MASLSPAAALAEGRVFCLAVKVRHTRLGRLRHAFTYRADYLLFSPEAARVSQGLLRRNAWGLVSLWDRDHGGPPKAGRGAAWAWDVLAQAGIPRTPDMVLGLLTQPRAFGFGFNPVSFWFLWQGDALKAVIAEVTNTWGHRLSYLCRRPDGAPLQPRDMPRVEKAMYVSPFQDVGGHYRFRFAISQSDVDVLICHDGTHEGLVARLQGALEPLSQKHLVTSLLARPGGALRVLALIYVQALRLKLQGASWRPLPPSPSRDVSE